MEEEDFSTSKEVEVMRYHTTHELLFISDYFWNRFTAYYAAGSDFLAAS